LIAADRVLTAGHCVWDDRDTQGPFEDLAFAPAQWKKDGKITAPLGKVDWDYVTLFEAYVNDPDGDGLAYDVAVITLSKAVGQQLGYLGIRADPSPCPTEAMSLTLAGYPGDDPEYPIPGGWQGGCFYDVCQVNFSCSVSITNHTCDSYVGQSGAPMYDKQHYVRAVHTLGVLPGFSNSNGAITIQKFILDNVMGYWRETNGFTALAPGSVGTGSYY
jgi:V8-like Glu-specific endopeptidase